MKATVDSNTQEYVMKIRSLAFVAITSIVVAAGILSGGRSIAQSPPATPQQAGDAPGTFQGAAGDVHRRLEDSLAELTRLREQIAGEKIPLSRQLTELESELTEARAEFSRVSRVLDSRTLDLNALRNEIKARQEEATYLTNLLGEYVRTFESRLHVAELQRHRAALDDARLAAENSSLAQSEIFDAQVRLLARSIERLHEAAGGLRFDGQAVDSRDGLVKTGTITLVGPAAIFSSGDGAIVGTAEQRLGSLEPTIIAFEHPDDIVAAGALASTVSTATLLPFDPTMGNAHKISETKETLWEHVQKGGPVMVPIFVLAGLAFLVALYKWLTLTFVRNPSRKRIRALLAAVANRDLDGAKQAAKAIRGPSGKMLVAGVEHLHEPRELIEEVMYETVLSTRLRLQRMLPFIAICAASAPLLGLLGTVTGIMNTFKLITVFGTGDVKTLSGGISEALITTEFGLIVAIPSLLLHAFLSRKARGVIDQMEKCAVAFVNQVAKTPFRTPQDDRRAQVAVVEGAGVLEPKPQSPSAAQVTDALAELLEPLVKRNMESQQHQPHTAARSASAPGPAATTSSSHQEPAMAAGSASSSSIATSQRRREVVAAGRLSPSETHGS